MQTYQITFNSTRQYIRWRRNINLYERFNNIREVRLTEKDNKLIVTYIKLFPKTLK